MEMILFPRKDKFIMSKLYEISYDEIKIIDPEIEKKITKEDWEKRIKND